MTLRLFLGVFPPPEVVAVLDRRLRLLPAHLWGIRWTKAEQLHVTLHFLGDTPDDRLEALVKALSEEAKGKTPFRTSLRGLGTFPERGDAKVVFVPVTEGLDEWSALVDGLRPTLKGLGFNLEERAFQPHLTLTRVKDPRHASVWLPEVRKAMGDMEASWTVDAFHLISSRLGPGGAKYETLRTYRLEKAG